MCGIVLEIVATWIVACYLVLSLLFCCASCRTQIVQWGFVKAIFVAFWPFRMPSKKTFIKYFFLSVHIRYCCAHPAWEVNQLTQFCGVGCGVHEICDPIIAHFLLVYLFVYYTTESFDFFRRELELISGHGQVIYSARCENQLWVLSKFIFGFSIYYGVIYHCLIFNSQILK